MAERPRNYAFEALAEVSGTDWSTGRGELNVALKSIREETQEEDDYLLADLIHERAKMYRDVMGEAMLTPTALAKHWKRVLEETSRKRPSERAPNQAAPSTQCDVCGGDRFVLVGTRPAQQSPWMREHGITPPQGPGMEEYAVCPDCNSQTDTSFRRYDGSISAPLDPEQVRQRLTR